jgi:hypothetical protein
MPVRWRGVRRAGGAGEEGRDDLISESRALTMRAAPAEMRYRRMRRGSPARCWPAKLAEIAGSFANGVAGLSGHVADLGGELGDGEAAGGDGQREGGASAVRLRGLFTAMPPARVLPSWEAAGRVSSRPSGLHPRHSDKLAPIAAYGLGRAPLRRGAPRL